MREICLNTIDYSTIAGDRILPFIITLDTGTSILDPAPGENQRFCYTVTAVGEDSSIYADLSHIVFSVCRDITLSSLSAVSVVINGVEQDVVLGQNVEILSPDPPTGCSGLKFDFGLDKISGIMTVCFSLNRAYSVGPVPVCLFGGGETASGLSVCGPVCQEGMCPATGNVLATVCVPVTVTPYAVVGEPVTVCCSEAVVSSGAASCLGTPGGSCTFTISQDVCVSVPVSFGANAVVGEHSVLCSSASGESCASCEAT